MTQQPAATPAADDALRAVRRWPSGAARAWTLGAVAEAERNGAIDAIVASGSAVRDVERSDDLDLVLVYRHRRPGLPRPPIEVDLRQYERGEVARKLEAGHDYLSWTVRYGRALFERGGWWSRLREDWCDRLPPPSAAEARERAGKAGRRRDEMLAAGDRDAAADLEIAMLTHLARAALGEAGVFPLSRPELADQLRGIGERALAERLTEALAGRPR